MSIILRGTLSFENYSQTLIKLTVDDQGFLTEHFFDKKTSTINTSNVIVEGEYLYILSDTLANPFQFIYSDVTNPTSQSIEEFLTIINGWFYTGGPEVSVNGGTPVGPLNVINFIEGTNVTITAVDNLPTNSVDVTINSSGGGGGVTAVTGTSPIFSSGGTTPDISIQQSSISQPGYLSSTDWNTFNNKVSSVTATSILTSSGGDNPNISSQVAKGKLVGRNSAVAGIMEEITVAGPGLTLVGTTLSATPPTIGYEMNFLLMGG